MNLDSLQKLKYAEEAEKSVVEINNWMFGISIGLFALIVFQMKDFDLAKYSYSENLYKILVIYSMIAIFVSGIVKYHLFIRKNKLNVKFAILQKIIMLKELANDDNWYKEWKPSFEGWVDELNKFSLMSKFVNLSIISTALLVLFLSIFILILIL